MKSKSASLAGNVGLWLVWLVKKASAIKFLSCLLIKCDLSIVFEESFGVTLFLVDLSILKNPSESFVYLSFSLVKP